MSKVKVGDTFYGFQHKSDRLGELGFCTNTQENCCQTLEEVLEELQDNVEDFMVWKLVRVS